MRSTRKGRRHMTAMALPTTVATVLTPIERIRVDVAAQGVYSTLHRSSIEDVLDDLRDQRAEAVLLSASRYDSHSSARMAEMVREFPRVPTFALLSDVQKSTPQSVHALGQIGVRTLIDVRQPSGWIALRHRLMEEQANDVQRLALGALNLDLVGSPADCWQFFELLFTHRPHIATVRQMGRYMNILPTTLMSRFYRAQLPSPKRYIDIGRLIRAARLLENTGLSVTTVAGQLDYSSPQAFSRHVRCLCGMSPVKFRQKFTGELLLQQFREELVLPYLDILRVFHPVEANPGWIPKTAIPAFTPKQMASSPRSASRLSVPPPGSLPLQS
ncbi:MAG TPA: AraC family transcriptional regulator [Gemmatimonadaceae bacterium]|jgi:AraC-like DNA-binding protein|nr:AraC family transcriptional regulator [Gemmatimonadaceae bacterium]